MENEQKNTKKIVMILSIVLVLALAVTGVSIWSYHVWKTNNDPQANAPMETDGETVPGEPAGDSSASASQNNAATQQGGKATTPQQNPAADLSDLGIPDEVLGKLTDPNATLPALTPEETATDAAVWGPEDEKPSGGTPVKNLSTVQQIVSYFNTAANQVKTGKPGLTAKTTMRIRENITGSSEAENSSQTYQKGTNLNDVFPVAGQSWSSKLDTKGVKSAVCSQKDGKYYITIHMKDEKNPKPVTSSHGKAFTCFDTQELMSMAAQTGDAEMQKLLKNVSFTANYSGCKIACVADAKTGKVLSAKYYTDITMKISISKLSILPISMTMNITTTQDFAMKW